jgi:thymidine phosphorylase
LASGAALDRLARLIARQGGDARLVEDDSVLPWAAHQEVLVAPRAGVVQTVDARLIGRASMRLGAGRDRVDDTIDPSAGIVLAVEPGDSVTAGAPLLTLHHGDRQVDEARQLAASAIQIGEAPAPAAPLILEWVQA